MVASTSTVPSLLASTPTDCIFQELCVAKTVFDLEVESELFLQAKTATNEQKAIAHKVHPFIIDFSGSSYKLILEGFIVRPGPVCLNKTFVE